MWFHYAVIQKLDNIIGMLSQNNFVQTIIATLMGVIIGAFLPRLVDNIGKLSIGITRYNIRHSPDPEKPDWRQLFLNNKILTLKNAYIDFDLEMLNRKAYPCYLHNIKLNFYKKSKIGQSSWFFKEQFVVGVPKENEQITSINLALFEGKTLRLYCGTSYAEDWVQYDKISIECRLNGGRRPKQVVIWRKGSRFNRNKQIGPYDGIFKSQL